MSFIFEIKSGYIFFFRWDSFLKNIWAHDIIGSFLLKSIILIKLFKSPKTIGTEAFLKFIIEVRNDFWLLIKHFANAHFGENKQRGGRASITLIDQLFVLAPWVLLSASKLKHVFQPVIFYLFFTLAIHVHDSVKKRLVYDGCLCVIFIVFEELTKLAFGFF